jgi:hypothetical protein
VPSGEVLWLTSLGANLTENQRTSTIEQSFRKWSPPYYLFILFLEKNPENVHPSTETNLRLPNQFEIQYPIKA